MCPVALVGALLIVLSSLLLGCSHSDLSYLFVHTFLCRETLVGVTTTPRSCCYPYQPFSTQECVESHSSRLPVQSVKTQFSRKDSGQVDSNLWPQNMAWF
jgi:hypothetical protein